MHPFHTKAGFVLPVVLGIVLIAGLLAVQAAIESGSTTLLATQRQLHQRAFELAESGIAAALIQLESGAGPVDTQTLRSAETSSDSSTVETTITARQTLPEGFSADRIAETAYEIRSTGHGARRSNITVVQGVRQLGIAVSP
jgi:Tfp pilus assembly protein PilX